MRRFIQCRSLNRHKSKKKRKERKIIMQMQSDMKYLNLGIQILHKVVLHLTFNCKTKKNCSRTFSLYLPFQAHSSFDFVMSAARNFVL